MRRLCLGATSNWTRGALQGIFVEVVNLLGEHPHAFESLKELVDRHPQSLQRVGGPPHPPWPLRKGLAAAEGRVESRKSTPAPDPTAGRRTASCWTRGGERDGEGAAGDNNAFYRIAPALLGGASTECDFCF